MTACNDRREIKLRLIRMIISIIIMMIKIIGVSWIGMIKGERKE